jgi:hypothetical protein
MKTTCPFFIVIALFASVNYASAQKVASFQQDSVEWVVAWHDSDHGFFGNSIYKMRGDTIVNGKLFSKVYLSSYIEYQNTNGDVLLCLIREDSSKKVYIKYLPTIYQDTSEFLLYDFNLEIGDSVVTKRRANYTDSTFNSTTTFFVTDTGSYTDTNGVKRRILTVSSFDEVSYWVEGIGYMTHPFHCELFDYWGSFWTFELTCFYTNGLFLFGWCAMIDIEEVEPSTPVAAISSTLVNDELRVSFEEEGQYFIKLYDTFGRLALNTVIVGSEAIIYNTFGDGIYLITISDAKGNKWCANKIVFAK